MVFVTLKSGKLKKKFQVAQFRGTVHFTVEGDGVCNTTVRKMFVKNSNSHT
jgi:hypothetical protein